MTIVMCNIGSYNKQHFMFENKMRGNEGGIATSDGAVTEGE